MERKEDENEETTSEEEEEVPGASACNQHNENSGITDATRCPSSNENQGVLRNDDSGRDENFLSPISQFRDYAKPPSCSTPLVARDGDSSAVCNIEDTLGNGMASPQSDPFLCNLRMSLTYNEDTLSTIESPTREPGLVSSHLFEPASLQLLPEAQLNLSLENKIAPNYADGSTPGESTSSDPSSQLLRETQDSNSLVSNSQSTSRRPKSSIDSAVRCCNDPSSQLLPKQQDSKSLLVSDRRSRSRHRRSTSSTPSAVRCGIDASSQLLSQTQDSNALVVSDDQSRRSRSKSSITSTDSSAVSNIDQPLAIGMSSSESYPFLYNSGMSIWNSEDTLSIIESPARELGLLSSHLSEPASLQLLPEAQINLSPDSNNPPNYADGSRPGESTSSDPSSQLLLQTQDRNALVVSDDLSRHSRSTSCPASTVRCHGNPPSQSLPQTQDSNSSSTDFICKIGRCDRGFTYSFEFSRHVNLHFGKRPHVCGKCAATFERSENLDAHELTHGSDCD